MFNTTYTSIKNTRSQNMLQKKKPTDKLLSIRAPRGTSHGTPWDDTLSTSSLRKDEILYFFQEIL